MQIYKSKEMCTGCSACSNVCEKHAVKMISDEKGFLYPVIDEEKCVECGMCRRVCHTYKEKKRTCGESAFAYVNENKITLMESSSGGAFSFIANEILRNQGFVCGAVFDENMKVKHIIADNKSEVSCMRKSKYVQSDMGNVYQKIKKLLIAGEKVLFTGTPCQVIGLKTFLNKEYDKLFCVDIICHSAPSPLIFEKYLLMKEKELGKIEGIDFRDKSNGYINYSVRFHTLDGDVFEEHKTNRYIQGFTGDLYSRDCCENCPAKERVGYFSDITLGDLWGGEKFASEIDFSKGASLVVVHTLKGASLMKNTSMVQVDLEEAIKNNPMYRFSHKKNKDADSFWKIFSKKGLEEAYNYIYNPSLFRKIKMKVLKMSRK